MKVLSVLLFAVTVCAAGQDCRAQSVANPVPPRRAPVVEQMPPIPEFTELYAFSASPEQVEAWRKSEIGSPEKRRIWLALVGLLRSNNGYHTLSELEAVLSIKLVPDKSSYGGPYVWVANLGDAQISYFPHEETSDISVQWFGELKSSDCVSVGRSFSDVQLAGGVGYLSMSTVMRFRINGGSEEAVISGQRGVKGDDCLSGFSIFGHKILGT